MLEIVEKHLIKYNIAGKKLMLAFSGGYDSTVLLNILKNLRFKLNFELCAIHLNHNWRGDESDREEQFCKDFCQNNNIEFFTKKLPLNSTVNELEAREARYSFFEEIYKTKNCDYLLTAHTKSDNSETIIYRLAKGAGIQGMKGIQECVEMFGMKILRPLITVSRSEIEKYIDENNLKVNFDSSNKNKKYLRNKVRLEIVPKFREICGSFEDNILNTSKIAGFYDDALDYYLKKDNIFLENYIDTKKFLHCPFELQNIILYKFLFKNNLEITFKQIQLLLKEIQGDLTNSGKYFSLTSGIFVLIRKDKIEIVENLNEDVSKYKFFCSEVCGKIDKFPNGCENYIYADKSAIKEPLCLRKRKEGDVFQPFGMQGKMKLKKFLNMKGVPKLQRDNLILLTNSDNEILWIYPLATSEIVRVKNSECLKIEIKRAGKN